MRFFKLHVNRLFPRLTVTLHLFLYLFAALAQLSVNGRRHLFDHFPPAHIYFIAQGEERALNPEFRQENEQRLLHDVYPFADLQPVEYF